MYDNEYRNELIEAMKKLSKEGFKCFIIKENPSYLYGHIITPNDNVIYIQRDTFTWRGWTTSLAYKPNKNTGTGCACFEEPFQTITKDIILNSEIEGLRFAKKLKATLYKSNQEWFDNRWNKDDMIEIKEEV